MVDELKAKAYDMDKLYEEYKQKMDAIIKEAEAKSAAIGGVAKEEPVEEKVSEETVEIPAEVEIVETPVEDNIPEETVEIPAGAEIVEAPVEENISGENVEIPPAEEVSLIQEPIPEMPSVNEEVIIPPVVEESVVPVQEEGIVVPEETVSVIQPEIENVGSQTLEQTPLTPEVAAPAVEKVQEDTNIPEKTDLNAARPISITKTQNISLKKSKQVQKERVFGKKENNEVTVAPVEESVAPIETPAVQPSKSVADIDAEMNAMVTELATTTDEARANEINKSLAELNEQKKLLIKTA